MSVSAAMTTNQQIDQRLCAPSLLAAAGDGSKNSFQSDARGVSPFSPIGGRVAEWRCLSKQLALVETTSLNNFSPVMTSRSKKPNLQAAEAVGPPCVGSSGDGCR